MRSLRYLNTVLTVLSVLLALNLWTAWTGGPQMAPSAEAQSGIPDAGAQRNVMIDQLKKLNTAMDTLGTALKSGQVHVHVDAGADDSNKK